MSSVPQPPPTVSLLTPFVVVGDILNVGIGGTMHTTKVVVVQDDGVVFVSNTVTNSGHALFWSRNSQRWFALASLDSVHVNHAPSTIHSSSTNSTTLLAPAAASLTTPNATATIGATSKTSVEPVFFGMAPRSELSSHNQPTSTTSSQDQRVPPDIRKEMIEGENAVSMVAAHINAATVSPIIGLQQTLPTATLPTTSLQQALRPAFRVTTGVDHVENWDAEIVYLFVHAAAQELHENEVDWNGGIPTKFGRAGPRFNRQNQIVLSAAANSFRNRIQKAACLTNIRVSSHASLSDIRATNNANEDSNLVFLSHELRESYVKARLQRVATSVQVTDSGHPEDTLASMGIVNITEIVYLPEELVEALKLAFREGNTQTGLTLQKFDDAVASFDSDDDDDDNGDNDDDDDDVDDKVPSNQST